MKIIHSKTQIIETHYLGPTDTKGARIKAVSTSGISATVPFSYEAENPHDIAMLALREKLNWPMTTAYAGPTKRGYVYIFID